AVGGRIRIDPGARENVAHDVAGADGELTAVVEVGDRDAAGGAVDDIVRDHRAREGELGKDRDFPGVEADIAADLGVAGAVEPDRRESAIGNVVAGDDDAVGAEDIDAVAVLAIAAATPVDTCNAVARDDGRVSAVAAAPDADAGIAAIGDAAARDGEPEPIHGVDGRVPQPGEIAIVDDDLRLTGGKTAAEAIAETAAVKADGMA